MLLESKTSICYSPARMVRMEKGRGNKRAERDLRMKIMKRHGKN